MGRSLRRLVRPEIKQFAKRMRKAPTAHESLLWDHLRYNRLGGLKFRRQAVLRGYIVDFYCPSRQLAIEVDGPSHNARQDAIRDARILQKLSIETIRFSNAAVQNQMPEVLETIAAKCGLDRFPTNPQHSSSPQVFSKSLDGEDPVVSLYRSGKVGKSAKLKFVREMTERECAKLVELGVKKPGAPCPLQVYAEQEVAEGAVRWLAQLGIYGVVTRCLACGLLHVIEHRATDSG
jgi:very-short-patch-repair endonuclease